MNILRNISAVFSVWKKLISLIHRYPAVVMPFLYMALFDGIVLAIVFLAPRPPLSIVFAPIIKAFWGSQFLHYPVNFLLLPKLFTYGRYIMSFFAGIIFTGIASAFILQAYQNTQPRWWFGIQKAFRAFPRLFVVWGVTLAMLFVFMKAVSILVTSLHLYAFSFSLSFLASLLVQMAFAFAIPAVIVENKKIGPAFIRSFFLCKHYIFAAFLIVLIPGLLYIPLSFLYIKTPVLMERFAPEVVLYVLSGRIVLMTVIDFLVAASATLLLLIYRETEKGAVAL